MKLYAWPIRNICYSPIRIELFDQTIDSIRIFNPLDQKSIDKKDKIEIIPAREFPTHEEAIATFKTNYTESFPRAAASSLSLMHTISSTNIPDGIESYLPLFFKNQEMPAIFDYLDQNANIIIKGDLTIEIDNFYNELYKIYENKNVSYSNPLLDPQHLYLTKTKFNQIIKTAITTTQDGSWQKAPDLAINHRSKQPLEKFINFIKQHKQVVLIFKTTKRKQEIIEKLQENNINATQINKVSDLQAQPQGVFLLKSKVNDSIIFTAENLCIINEEKIFGKNIPQIAKKKQIAGKAISFQQTINNLTELEEGQAVVHIDKGIGLYRGLHAIEMNGQVNEFLKLEYQNADILYVPISSLGLISRYSGCDNEQVKLNRLGSAQWDKEKQKAIKQINDTAAELLDIYSKRAISKSIKFKLHQAEYQAFSDSFRFQETPDQNRAINEVIEDLCSDKIMDRLICGDVGFGKTEVAMRAAFIAITNNSQVMVLAPTTLLAEQHYHNFNERFIEMGITIESLSRFKTTKEQKIILENAEQGNIDVIIGTHKILNHHHRIKNTGLLIIDEEHKFGVRQKEEIKKLKSNINILAMTATPIPRTLNMVMSGIRDLSIISTPPSKRLAINTFLKRSSDHIIKEAITREIMRGGQAFYVHNDTITIDEKAKEINRLVPNVKIGIAHGKMSEKNLENVMTAFYQRKYQLLICTTIIENGIDIPNANTIIIDRADKFGLAQLHQLRGRVGRSHHQAYAYLLAPSQNVMTVNAKRRLEAFTKSNELGIGFILASQDLEIRGTGSLLGNEQSGDISKIGFSLYMEMLEGTIKSLKANKKCKSLADILDAQVEIDLGVSSLFPETYIRDPEARLSLYKRIASCNNDEDIYSLKSEVIDRFGRLPEESNNIFIIAEQKLKAKKLKAKKIKMHGTGGYIEFHEENNIDITVIVSLVQNSPHIYAIDKNNTLRFKLNLQEDNNKIEYLQFLINKLHKEQKKNV